MRLSEKNVFKLMGKMKILDPFDPNDNIML